MRGKGARLDISSQPSFKGTRVPRNQQFGWIFGARGACLVRVYSRLLGSPASYVQWDPSYPALRQSVQREVFSMRSILPFKSASCRENAALISGVLKKKKKSVEVFRKRRWSGPLKTLLGFLKCSLLRERVLWVSLCAEKVLASNFFSFSFFFFGGGRVGDTWMLVQPKAKTLGGSAHLARPALTTAVPGGGVPPFR